MPPCTPAWPCRCPVAPRAPSARSPGGGACGYARGPGLGGPAPGRRSTGTAAGSPWPCPARTAGGADPTADATRAAGRGSLTGEPIRVGEDPGYILAGRRILEVFWDGYWLPRLTDAERQQLTDEIVGSSCARELLKPLPGVNMHSTRSVKPSPKQSRRAGRERCSLCPERSSENGFRSISAGQHHMSR